MKNKYSHIVTWATLAILTMVGYIFFLMFGPYTVPKIGKIYPTDPVTAGTLSRYDIQDCRTTSQEAQISRTIVNTKDNIVIGVGTELRSFHCSNIVLIPQETPAGRYRLVIVARFAVNPIRSVLRVYQSEEFEVNNPNPQFVVPPSVREVTINQPALAFTPANTPSKSLAPATPTPTPQPSPAPSPSPSPSPQPGPIQNVIEMIQRLLQ